MRGPLLFFAEHMFGILVFGVLLGIGLLTAATLSLRRSTAGRRSRGRRLASWLALLVAMVITLGSGFILTQLGPAMISQGSMLGDPAPPLEFHDLAVAGDGRLEELRGRVVLVNFWATWCPPCREEMPDLDRLQARFAERGLVVLHISDEPPETIRTYLDSHPMSTRHGQVETMPWPEFGRPTTYVVDRTGVIRRIVQGHRDLEQFVDLIKPWL